MTEADRAGAAAVSADRPVMEAGYRSLVELSPDALIVHDGARILLANLAMAAMIGAARVDDVVGMRLLDIVAPSSQALVLERIRCMSTVDRRPLVDEVWRRRDGSEVQVEVAATPMPSLGSNAAMVIARDVTEQRRFQMERERLLAEKELLMQEVHHRVANNLQLVRSVLSLQARGVGNAELRAQLLEACTRIGTVGTLHSRLQQKGSVLEGDAWSYVESILDDLQFTLGPCYTRKVVLHERPERPLITDAGCLLALGLVVAEAVTNSFKYGEGIIFVAMQPASSHMVLTIEDEGPGFPQGFLAGKSGKGLGMRMITSLVEGRGGTVTIGGGSGSKEQAPSRITARIPLKFAG